MSDEQVYINGIGLIYPQPDGDLSGLAERLQVTPGNKLHCITPDFRRYIPADILRRMGRLIRMGVSASQICLADAAGILGCEEGQLPQPEGIITGTGFGCLEETEKFLSSMILNSEAMLPPAAFIQSTHNTISGQIAILLKCHGYNYTYTQMGNSFSCALLDSYLQIGSGECDQMLVGGFDELTDSLYTILGRFGLWKHGLTDNLHLTGNTNRGTLAGEGVAFTFLSNRRHQGTYGSLTGIKTTGKSEGPEEVVASLTEFLQQKNISFEEIGLLLLGFNGDPESDSYYHAVSALFPDSALRGYFKHLSGEFPTAGAIGFALAARILREGIIPDVMLLPEFSGDSDKFSGQCRKLTQRKVLVYNHYLAGDHSFFLLSGV